MAVVSVDMQVFERELTALDLSEHQARMVRSTLLRLAVDRRCVRLKAGIVALLTLQLLAVASLLALPLPS